MIDWNRFDIEIVAEADNGRSAVEQFLQVLPDIFLVDIRMPLLDGIEVIGQIRDWAPTHTEYLIISGSSDFKYAKSALKLGVSDYLLKPIDPEELSEAIRQILSRIQRMRQEIPVADGDVITKVKSYIRSHYNQDVSLKSCAEYCHLNPSYLSDLFKTRAGLNLSKYVEQIRVDRAKELLARNSLSIMEVSQLVGYEDSSYFSKVFRRHTGALPQGVYGQG